MTGPTYGSGYECGYLRCWKCGTRRPLSALGDPLAGTVAQRACIDEAWCERQRKAVDRKGAEVVDTAAARQARGG